MAAVLDFLWAALPWIVIGLFLAVFFARSAKKKKDEEQKDDYGTTGMCLGMCFGTAIGTALGNNTGIGISITANKVPGVRAALCGDCFSAKATREHNDANILALGARVTGPGLALLIVDTFLDTPFSGDERHVRRISMIEE